MSALKLATLNAFRHADGKAPYAAWKASRHAAQLEAYQTEAGRKAQTTNGITVADLVAQGSKPARVAELPAPHAMRPLNEALGDDIKTTREAWRASGANMTKKEYVVGLLEVGATIKTIVDKMGVTETAARSLIGDVRRMPGYKVERKDDVYFVIAPDMSEGDEGDE